MIISNNKSTSDVDSNSNNRLNSKCGFSCNCTNSSLNDDCVAIVNSDDIFIEGICQNENGFIEDNMWSQNSISGGIYVPKEKPSINAIDSVIADVSILSKRVVETPAYYSGTTITPIENFEGKISTGRKLVIEGTLAFTVSYVSVNDDNCVHSFHDQIIFSSFLVLPSDTDLNDDFVVTACVEDILVKEYCPRSISLNVILTLQATKPSYNSNLSNSTCNLNNNTISSCENHLVTKGVCSYDKITSLFKTIPNGPEEWTEFNVYSNFRIDGKIPEVSKVLSTVSNIQLLYSKVIQTPISNVSNTEGNRLTGRKLIIQGNLISKITYVSNNDCNSVHSIRITTPFTTYIVLENTSNSLSLESCYKVISCIEDIYSCAFSETGIFQSATIFLKAQKIS